MRTRTSINGVNFHGGLFLLLAGWLAAVALPATAQTPIGDTTADRVLGQLDFSRNSANLVDGRGFAEPNDVAIDRSSNPNRVYVADTANNRVLAWRNADTWADGDAADVVIGQPDFLSDTANNGGVSDASLRLPNGVAVDAGGNLYVADSRNNRVLRYDTPLATGADQLADVVLGQPNMSSAIANNGGRSASSLLDPFAVAVDGNANLYVADLGNQRLLRYTLPLTNGQAASQVLGQPDFSSSGSNNPTRSASSLATAFHLAVDGNGNLYLADFGNSRVLQYNTPATTDNVADRVFGQVDMTSDDAGTTPTRMFFPTGVALSPASDQLYVVDFGNRRVLRFDLPGTAANGPAANLVLGQSDFVSSLQSTSATGLSSPIAAAVDSAGNLYVADGNDYRVIFYGAPTTNGQAASRVLGQANLNAGGRNRPEGQGLSAPSGVAIDTSVAPNRVYAADFDNHRILAWHDATAFANGAAADVVIGQPDFDSTSSGLANNRLNEPQGLAVDVGGNLYVADSENHRVLRFDTPLNEGSDQLADLVLGQVDFDSGDIDGGIATSQNGMSRPFGVALDAMGNVYVADANNNRVLRFDSASGFSNGQNASLVLGHANFSDSGPNPFFDPPAPPTATNMALPTGLIVDENGNLYVSDSQNNRVLRFSPPINSGDAASAFVIGQADLNSNGENAGGLAQGLDGPTGLALDSNGNLYLVDRFNHRLLQYENPLLAHNDALPDRVFGQLDLSTETANLNGLSALSLNEPAWVAVDGLNNVFVSDEDNSRVLEFARPLAADFGDAPASYGTTQANNGARHRKGAVLLGSALDFEDDGLPSTLANSDDLNGADNDNDEDGITIFPNLAIGEGNAISVVGTTAAMLSAWLDLNGDGVFTDPDEKMLSDQPTSGSAELIIFTVPNSATAGTSYARLRLSSAGGLGPLGVAEDGEVEDYQVLMGFRPSLTTPADQVTNEDTAISNLAITVADQDSGTAGLTLWAASSNQALIPDANLVIGGSNANRTLTITPAADQNGGPVTINLSVQDDDFLAETTFEVEVTAVNDAPTLDGIGNFAMPEDAGPLTINLGGISAGPGGEPESVSLLAQSSNPAVVPVPTLNYSSPNTTGTLLLALAPDANGSATITLTVDDGQAANNQISRSFNVTVSPVNDPPTLDALVAISVLEDSGPHTVDLAGISNGPPDEAGALQLSVSSSNPQLIPQPTLSYSSPAISGSLSFTPTPNLTGNSTLEVTVTDAEGAQRARSLVVTVSNVDDAPRISAIADQSVAEDGLLGPIAFTVEDFDEAAPVQKGSAVGRKTLDDLQLSVSSSNPALLPGEAVSFSGSGANRSFTLQPAADQNGESTVVITVTDPQGLSHSASFNLTVTPVPDAPVAEPLSFSLRQNDVFFGRLSGTDVDGDRVFYRQLTSTRNGTVEVFSDGSFRYASPPETVSGDSFQFIVTDGELNSLPSTVTIEIIATPQSTGGGQGGTGSPPGNAGPAPTPLPSPTPEPTPAPTPPEDRDGVDGFLEDQVGDGNGDGVPDSAQARVASLPFSGLASLSGDATRRPVTVAILDEPQIPGTPPSVLENVRSRPLADVVPAAVTLPTGVTLAEELLSFDVTNLDGAVGSRVEVILGAVGTVPAYDRYYKFGSRSPGAAPEFYEFMFDGQTGAVFQNQTRSINGVSTEVLVLTLVLLDGGRGDADLSANGRISDPGVLAVVNPETGGGGGSSGSFGLALIGLLSLLLIRPRRLRALC